MSCSFALLASRTHGQVCGRIIVRWRSPLSFGDVPHVRLDRPSWRREAEFDVQGGHTIDNVVWIAMGQPFWCGFGLRETVASMYCGSAVVYSAATAPQQRM